MEYLNSTIDTSLDYSHLYSADHHEKFIDLHRPILNEWFDSTRGGDTGQGHTWETRIAKKVEDNEAKADIFETEVKTTSSPNDRARVRMFTQCFGTEPALFAQCSHITSGGVRRLARQIRTTSNARRAIYWNGHEVDLKLTSSALQLTAGSLITMIGRAEFERILAEKIKNLVIIHTRKRKNPNDPEQKKMQYQYHGFTYYGGIIPERFYEFLETGKIAIEFRLKGETIEKMDKDNGTSFNITKNLLKDLYAYEFPWNGDA